MAVGSSRSSEDGRLAKHEKTTEDEPAKELSRSTGQDEGASAIEPHEASGARGLPQSVLWPHADRVSEEFVRLVDAHDGESPFLLYLHFMDVHQYGASNEFKRFGTGDRGDYLAAIRWVDDAVERVRSKLGEAGRLDEPVMVLTSDHGEEFGEHGVTGGREIVRNGSEDGR